MRILYVHPRLIGSAADWSGVAEPDGKSWLIEHTKELGFNAMWFSPFFATSDVAVERHGNPVAGSLYAMKDHLHLDREFSAAPGEGNTHARGKIDDAHMRHFAAQAKEAGITLMGDLVFNHVARDHPQVLKENAAVDKLKATAQNLRPIMGKGYDGADTLVGMTYDAGAAKDKTLFFKFRRDPDFSLQMPGVWTKKWDDGAKREVDFFEKWDDVAPINYASPAAQDFFINGENGRKGYWKEVIDWHLDRGFTGFRCDAAYMIPAPVWSTLMQYAHDRKPDVVVMGETLGDNGKADALGDAKITVNGKQRQAFDLAMLPTYWWNFKDDWMIAETARMQRVARLGGAGFPDNHDTMDTVAGHAQQYFASLPEAERNRAISDVCLRNYAVSTLIANSVYMQLGYEYCRKQISVFRDPSAAPYFSALRAERGDAGHPLNLTARIRAINDFKEQLHNANALVELQRITPFGPDKRLLKIECALTHCETRENLGNMVLYVNEKPELGPVRIKEKDLRDPVLNEAFNRVVLGPADAEPENIREINDVAAFYTPRALPAAAPQPAQNVPPPRPAAPGSELAP